MFKRVLMLLAAALSVSLSFAAWSQVKEIPWGTSAVGSAGHKALVVLADMLNKEMPKYRVTVQPTPGAIVTVMAPPGPIGAGSCSTTWMRWRTTCCRI